jgi:isopenicillin-N N-acyltransferase-like protein
VQAHLAERAGSIQPTDLMTAFADRYGSPRAVCRSPVTGPGGKTSSTVATVVMDTTARKMWVAKQPYDDHYYREYALD